MSEHFWGRNRRQEMAVCELVVRGLSAWPKCILGSLPMGVRLLSCYDKVFFFFFIKAFSGGGLTRFLEFVCVCGS